MEAMKHVLDRSPACLVARPRVAMSAGGMIIASADVVDYSRTTSVLIHVARTGNLLHLETADYVLGHHKYMNEAGRFLVSVGMDVEYNRQQMLDFASKHHKHFNMFSGKMNTKCTKQQLKELGL